MSSFERIHQFIRTLFSESIFTIAVAQLPPPNTPIRIGAPLSEKPKAAKVIYFNEKNKKNRKRQQEKIRFFSKQ